MNNIKHTDDRSECRIEVYSTTKVQPPAETRLEMKNGASIILWQQETPSFDLTLESSRDIEIFTLVNYNILGLIPRQQDINSMSSTSDFHFPHLISLLKQEIEVPFSNLIYFSIAEEVQRFF